LKILYASCASTPSTWKRLFEKSKSIPGQAVQKYHRLLIRGIAKDEGCDITAVCVLPVTRQNYPHLMLNIKDEEEARALYHYISMVNLPGIKNLCAISGAFFTCLGQCIKNKDAVVICDILNMSVSYGAIMAAKVTGRKSVGIVTDVPSLLRSKKKGLLVKINNFLMKRPDAYVFLTPQMNELINTKNKPYVVIEGQVDENMNAVPNILKNKPENKIILYAGGIQKNYGIKILTEAFIDADIEGAELHIYGDGDYKDEIIDLCKRHKNVRYFGNVTNDIVIKSEILATLLVNPRPTTEEFVKYSFPSKNMEYMASGTPVLTTKLPGMPIEYYNHVYLIEDESHEGMVSTLKNVLSLDKKILYQKGKAAKEFVLKEKNNVVQAHEIIKIIREII